MREQVSRAESGNEQHYPAKLPMSHGTILTRQAEGGVGLPENRRFAPESGGFFVQLRRQGKRISRRPPFGFGFRDGVLVPVDGEQEILTRMLELRAAGLGSVRIGRALNDEGLVNPRTGRPWYHQAIYGVLRTAERRD